MPGHSYLDLDWKYCECEDLKEKGFRLDSRDRNNCFNTRDYNMAKIVGVYEEEFDKLATQIEDYKTRGRWKEAMDVQKRLDRFTRAAKTLTTA